MSQQVAAHLAGSDGGADFNLCERLGPTPPVSMVSKPVVVDSKWVASGRLAPLTAFDTADPDGELNRLRVYRAGFGEEEGAAGVALAPTDLLQGQWFENSRTGQVCKRVKGREEPRCISDSSSGSKAMLADTEGIRRRYNAKDISWINDAFDSANSSWIGRSAITFAKSAARGAEQELLAIGDGVLDVVDNPTGHVIDNTYLVWDAATNVFSTAYEYHLLTMAYDRSARPEAFSAKVDNAVAVVTSAYERLSERVMEPLVAWKESYNSACKGQFLSVACATALPAATAHLMGVVVSPSNKKDATRELMHAAVGWGANEIDRTNTHRLLQIRFEGRRAAIRSLRHHGFGFVGSKRHPIHRHAKQIEHATRRGNEEFIAGLKTTWIDRDGPTASWNRLPANVQRDIQLWLDDTTAVLEQAFPKEQFVLEELQLLRGWSISVAHIDNDYLSALITLNDVGTDVFTKERGTKEHARKGRPPQPKESAPKSRSPFGGTTILSGNNRRMVLDRPVPTVHETPLPPSWRGRAGLRRHRRAQGQSSKDDRLTLFALFALKQTHYGPPTLQHEY